MVCQVAETSCFEPRHREIDVCDLTSCLRSRNRPKEAVSYADPCATTEYMVSDHWNFEQQLIPEDFFGPVERTAVDPYTEVYRNCSLRDLANALRQAQDLANGRGLLDDEEDSHPWNGVSNVSAHEVRKPPLR